MDRQSSGFLTCRRRHAAAEWLIASGDWRALAVDMVATTAISFGVACVTYAIIEKPCVSAARRLWEARGRRRVAAVHGL